MAVYKGHLDDLLNTSIPYADFQAVTDQRYTATSTNASIARINTLSVIVQSGQPLGIYNSGPYSVTAIDDINNTFTVSGIYAGTNYSVLYYVLGYNNGYLIFGTRDSVTTAGYASTSASQLNTNIGIYSPTPDRYRHGRHLLSR